MNKTEIYDIAINTGKQAFNNGLKCIPAKDPAVERLFKEYPGNAIIILKGWHKGFSEANCSVVT